MPREINISVVIPVKNGERYLDSVLKAVFAQEVDAGFEVILIDSGSKDKTKDIAKDYPVKLLEIDGRSFNHGLTRNYGISKTQGEYVVLMTADAIPYNKHWLAKLVRSLKTDAQVAGAYSRQIPHQDARPLTKIRINRLFTASKLRRESQLIGDDAYCKLSAQGKYFFGNFDNVSSCIKKLVWKKIPFPKTDFAEDLEWAKCVLEAGYKIVYEPESVVYHSHEFSVLGWYRKNLVNYSKLYSLFGFCAVNNVYKLVRNFIIYTIRDTYFLCKGKNNLKIILANIYLIPLYAFSAVLGQYRGFKANTHPRSQ